MPDWPFRGLNRIFYLLVSRLERSVSELTIGHYGSICHGLDVLGYKNMTKVCKICGVSGPHGTYVHARNGRTYAQSRCKSCASGEFTKRTQSVRKSDGARLTRLKQQSRTWKLDVVELEGMLWVQDNKCAICSVPDPDSVDHDHVTGKIRGFLCRHCNLGLGHFRDSEESLKSAVAYLEMS